MAEKNYTSGIRVLALGRNLPSPLLKGANQYEVRNCGDHGRVLSEIAGFRPDVLVTFGFIPSVLSNHSFEIRKKWINVDPKASDEAIWDAIESCYRTNLFGSHKYDAANPLVSVYTGTFNSGDYLHEAFQSLLDQTYKTWEWVVVDDGSTDRTMENLAGFAARDFRVRPFSSPIRSGKIGAVKDMATRLCRGPYLVELDHDDWLTDFALDEVRKAFDAHPDVGFVYSNSSDFFEDGSFRKFDDAFWKGRYRETEYRGKKYSECVCPDIYGSWGRNYWDLHGWFLTVGPNHLRAYRASVLRELGGYNPNLPVADDWDLFARAFLRSKCHHIDKMLYFYRVKEAWSNTSFVRNKSIQDHLAHARNHLASEFDAYNRRRLAKLEDSVRTRELAPSEVKPDLAVKDVSFVIPVAKPGENLIACVGSIRKWAPGSEVVVVANGCDIPADVKPDKVVPLELNLRFGAACNRGAMEASRTLVCIMNDDARFVDDTPVRLVASLAASSAVIAPFSNRAKPPQGDVERANVPGHDLHPEMVVGVCMMMSADLFRTLGGFDTRLDTYEDDDICLRARRLGFPSRVVGGTYVEHDRHATFKALGEDVQKVMNDNRRKFARLHPKVRVVAIAKNEEGCVRGFFEQFATVTKDWCLLDTGSTDKTMEIARSIGVKVEQGPFKDFSTARNDALGRLAGDAEWVIMMDPDERLDAHTIRNLQGLLCGPHDIYLSPLEAVNRDGSRTPFVPKPFLFRNRPEIRWTLPVHEKLVGSMGQALVRNAMIQHMIALHDPEKRKAAAQQYRGLGENANYYQTPEYREVRAKWPILDYERADDERIVKVYAGPLVSAVIPTHKRPELLAKAIASALTQDYLNLEVVVVGDCDPALPAPQGRVRVFNLPKNHGAGGAVPRNYGIMAAAGEYIAYLDDDNEWTPDHVSSVYEAMRVKDAPFGFSSMRTLGAEIVFKAPELGRIDTSAVIHRKDLVPKKGWWMSREEDGYAHDWKFIERIVAGERWAATGKATLLYNAETSGQEAFLRAKIEAAKVPPGASPASESKDVLLTIVVPTLVARQKMFDSLMGQLLPQIEGKPIELLVKRDNQEATISEKRQSGFLEAKGKYVVFIDDDDRIEPTYVDDIMEALRSDPDCVVFDIMVTGYPGGAKVTKVGVEFGEDRNAPEAYYRAPTYLMPMRREIAIKVPFQNVWDEDSKWAAKIKPLIDPAKQVRIPKILYHYQYDPKTTTQGAVWKILEKRGVPKA